MAGVKEVFPNAEHRKCMFHLVVGPKFQEKMLW
jgi:hypothetical protein